MANIIFDLDDSLIETQPQYSEKIERWCGLMQHQGFGKADAKAVLNAVDGARIPIFGFAKERWPGSLRRAYFVLCQEYGRPEADLRVAGEAEAIGWSVFTDIPPLIEGAKELLETLDRDHDLFMLTSGDEEVQRAKVRVRNLGRYFWAIEVVDIKNADAFAWMLERHNLDSKDTWMIGNSPRSDINPALANGLKCILLRGHTWFHDEEPLGEGTVYEVDRLDEIPAVLEGN